MIPRSLSLSLSSNRALPYNFFPLVETPPYPSLHTFSSSSGHTNTYAVSSLSVLGFSLPAESWILFGVFFIFFTKNLYKFCSLSLVITIFFHLFLSRKEKITVLGCFFSFSLFDCLSSCVVCEQLAIISITSCVFFNFTLPAVVLLCVVVFAHCVLFLERQTRLRNSTVKHKRDPVCCLFSTAHPPNRHPDRRLFCSLFFPSLRTERKQTAAFTGIVVVW